MKLHVHFQTGEMKINEVVEGATAEAVVAAMQKRVASEAGFIVGAIVRKMTPLAFAQEATRRYNTALKDTMPVPQSCVEFIQMGRGKGFADLLDDNGAVA